MTVKLKKQTEADYQALQEELELRYGPALAQDIVDQIKKAEKDAEYIPGYMPVKAASEAVELFRSETRKAVDKLKSGKKDRKSKNKNVACLETERQRQECERLFGLYFDAQRAFYLLYRRAIASHVEELPASRKYRRLRQEPEMASFFHVTTEWKKAA